MSEFSSSVSRDDYRDAGQANPVDRVTRSSEGLGRRVLWLAVTPALVATVVAMATVAYLLIDGTVGATGLTIMILVVAVVVCLAAIGVAASRARKLTEEVDDQVAALRPALESGQQELRYMIDQLRRGQLPEAGYRQRGRNGGGEFAMLANEVDRLCHLAATAVEQVGLSAPGTTQQSQTQQVPQVKTTSSPAAEMETDHRVGVFVNLARRLQSLVHREIQLLDDLESQVEDPDLLKGLFSVDHLATRIRRHAENLAVLGGAVSRRQWSRPVNIYEVLRSAVAEVEQYSRVKLVRPIEGNLQGHAVADTIHLVAELVENATRFSAPATQVLLRAQRVTAGLAVEVEDRGLGIPRDEQGRINAMLSDPEQINIDDLLQDGRIGLYVVSALARRHSVAVQLQTNIYGGIQAIIVIPNALLGGATDGAANGSEPMRTITSETGSPAAITETEPPAAIAQRQETPQAARPRHAASETSLPEPMSTPPYQDDRQPSANSEPVSTPPLQLDRRSEGHSEPVSAPSLQGDRELGAYASAPVSTPPGGQRNRESSDAPMTRVRDTGTDYFEVVSQTRERYSRPSPGPAGSRPTVGSGHAFSEVGEGGWQPVIPDSRQSPESRRREEIPPSRPSPRPDRARTPESPAWGAESFNQQPIAEDRTPPPSEGRPKLPQRHAQTHLAPQLSKEPPPATPTDSTSAGHDPGLMVAFQRGFDRVDDPVGEDSKSSQEPPQ